MHRVELDEVVTFYLYSEIGRLVNLPFLGAEAQGKIEKAIQAIRKEEQTVLLKALSVFFRNNPVYDFTQGQRKLKEWSFGAIDAKSVVIKAVNDKTNKILDLPNVNHSLYRFATYLQEYFHEYPGSDPKGLSEFRGKLCQVCPNAIIVRELKDQAAYEIIDGVHRAVDMVIGNQGELLKAYVGHV